MKEKFSVILFFLRLAGIRKSIILLGMMIVMALLDILGVASILPFIAVMSNPEMVQDNILLNRLFVASMNIGVSSTEEFMFCLGILVFLMLTISLCFKAATNYVQVRFVYRFEFIIAKRLIEGYLHQPYCWFLNQNSADLGKTILSEVNAVIGYGVAPFLTLIAQTAVALALVVLLMTVDLMLAISSVLVLGGTYLTFFVILSSRLKHYGDVRTQANQDRFIALGEALGAVKEVKLGGLEQVYLERFARTALLYTKGQAGAQLFAQLPRFALEIVAFGGILLAFLYIMQKNNDISIVLPVISLYAFAGYRLMPALQQIYGALVNLRFINKAIAVLYDDLKAFKGDDSGLKCRHSLRPTEAIEISQVSYRYLNAPNFALKNVNMVIPVNSRVGLIGSTGSGKTTLVDVILGLLQPQEGRVLLDGEVLTAEGIRQWQASVGYVPQRIYLADDSIAANIAFGVNIRDIDMIAVEQAAKIVALHDFVSNDLPDGYSTVVGERGIRLSGGEIQRIGIARALYHDPDFLILDEATSALDNLTESAVMDALENLKNNKTVILIAHRLSTVRECDQIYLLEHGEVIANGSFAELTRTSVEFARLNNSI